MSELVIAGHKIWPGERARFEISLPSMANSAEVGMPVEVVRGDKPGPILLITAAIHGDEVNGVETIHRLLKSKKIKNLVGTLICVPIVNVYGFNSKIRYLPDRRDLNRCFPGKPDGTLGGRIAHTILHELVVHATHVVDIHTGAIHRSNIPQVRASLDTPKIEKLAKSFGAHVIINSSLRDGSFREAVREMGKPILLYEGGQALRFEEGIIKSTVKGIFELMKNLEMIKGKKNKLPDTMIAQKTYWIRASESGIFKVKKPLGAIVKRGDVLAVITDPYGKSVEDLRANYDGVIIGCTNLPLIMAGEATFHIGLFEDIDFVEEYFESLELAFDSGQAQ